MPGAEALQLLQLPLAGIQMGLGTWQYIQAVKQALKNKRPTYEIDPSYQYSIDVLKNTMGLPQSALDLYYRNVGQNTNQGINAILGAGGNGNQISNLVGNQNQQYQQIAVQDALQKKQDIGGVLQAQLALAGEKDKAWQVNLYAPWADRAQAIASQKNAGLQNIGGAFNSIAGAGANYATSKLADSIGGSGVTNTMPTMQPTTPNSGVNTNQLFQQFRQLQPQLNFGQQGQQFNFQQPQGLPFTPQFQPQSYNSQAQLPYPSYGYQNNSPYGNMGLDYNQFWNYIMGIQNPNVQQQVNQYTQ